MISLQALSKTLGSRALLKQSRTLSLSLKTSLPAAGGFVSQGGALPSVALLFEGSNHSLHTFSDSFLTLNSANKKKKDSIFYCSYCSSSSCNGHHNASGKSSGAAMGSPQFFEDVKKLVSDPSKRTLSTKKSGQDAEDEAASERNGSKEGMKRIFEGNRKWVESKLKDNPDYFKNLKKGQQPRYLFIGCSDSRVPANEITGLDAGELFVHRNIANMVVNSDMNMLSVLQYSVQYLKVKDIIVCGHYGCGGVDAAMNNKDLGLIDHWLRNIRDVSRIHQKELVNIPDRVRRHERLIELNVVEQCINLYKNGIVQAAQSKYGFPRIHGLVYDIGNGLLKKLDVDFKEYTGRYQDIYRLYHFDRFQYVDENISRAELQKRFVKTYYQQIAEDDEANLTEGKLSTKPFVKQVKNEPDLFSKEEVDYILASAPSTGEGLLDLDQVIQAIDSYKQKTSH